MIVYGFLALALISSWGYSFYKGYQWANKDYVIRQQTAKIRHLEVTKRYFSEASNKSENEANIANERLAVTSSKLAEIEADIKAGKLGKACSDDLFARLRRAQ